MSRKTLVSVATAAALAVPALAAAPASADHGDMYDHGFYVFGFGVCWYGTERDDSYFGMNVRCPVQPMPGDSRRG